MVDFHFEEELWNKGLAHVAGVDEAGRGPLAGPVVAAAAIFPSTIRTSAYLKTLTKVDDSKTMSSKLREELFEIIQQESTGFGIGIVDHAVIDRINIRQASLLAMADAVKNLSPLPDFLLVDGPASPESTMAVQPIIDGDALCFSIAAASILAKVTRDRMMMEFDKFFPQYGFAKHKGYGTREHYEALGRFGPCEIHRKSFRLIPRVKSVNSAAGDIVW